MGQTLSEPVTAKETSSCGNNFVKVGSSCMQGWRINMEDAHTHLLAVPDDKEACFFAVYDGHGGAKVAQYAGHHLHKKIIQSEPYVQGNIEEAIRQGFLKLDEDMIKDEEMHGELAGTTAVTVIIKENKMYCGNAGDSRAVASCSGVAEALSFDHKPANEEEAKRIIAAGGWVEFNRVNGNLALSRALGDFVFKQNDDKRAEEQIVTAFPDVIVRDLTEEHEFIILACDGIWDVMTNQEVVDFCRDRVSAGMEPEKICEELLTRCLAPDCQMGGLGCDNMTVVLVCLLQHRGWDVLRQKCARPRRPTPPPSIDGDDDLHGGFVTPPRTPIAAMASAPAALILNNEERDVSGSGDEQRCRSGGVTASSLDGDQMVPEVVRESSSDSEPAVTPAKQGKMSFAEEDLAQKERQHFDDEDAPPDVFSSESSAVDEFHPAHETFAVAQNEASRMADQSHEIRNIDSDLPSSPMDTSTAATTTVTPTAPPLVAHPKSEDEEKSTIV